MIDRVEYKEITYGELEDYKDLILPMVYEELEEQEAMNEEYMCIAACVGSVPVSVIVADFEDDGNLNLLSIWTDVSVRRKGIASALFHKAVEVALHLYDWEDGQYGDDILMKTMYCLASSARTPFEEWLKKNDFTSFSILKAPEGDFPEVYAATAEIHFYRYESGGRIKWEIDQ